MENQNMNYQPPQEGQYDLDDQFLEGKYEDPLDRRGKIKLAQIHGSAQKVYHIPDKLEGKSNVVLILEVDFCDCCILPVEESGVITPFPYCVDNKQLTVCGIGTYLYFYFYKVIVYCMLVILCMSAIPFMLISKGYSNEVFLYCSKYQLDIAQCNWFNASEKNMSDWMVQISYEPVSHFRSLTGRMDNGQEHLNQIVDYQLINFMTWVVLIFINCIMINNVRTLSNEADISAVTPSDYTLMVSNIPNEFKDLDELNSEILETVYKFI